MVLRRIETRKLPTKQKKKRKILYVEDNDTNWDIAKLQLDEKYDLTRAINSRETFEKIGENEFDMILMDIELNDSDLDGVAITEILKGKITQNLPHYAAAVGSRPDTPIVFVTAYASSYSKEMLKASGGDDIVSKPVNFVTLSFVMSGLIAQKVQKRLKG